MADSSPCARTVDPRHVKGLEKLTCVRLAEVISQKNTISSEVITEALYAQDKHGDAFVQTLVTGGHITEWDLAKLVAENFQLPFLMASSYAISEEAKKRVPETMLFENLIVPIDVFDDVLCVAMPILSTYDQLNKLQRDLKCEIFPYVGLISENKKVLASLFPSFKTWFEQDQKRRENAATKRANTKEKGGDWMSIFDAGDAAIQDNLGGIGQKKSSAPPKR
jgi:hypothetical protein